MYLPISEKNDGNRTGQKHRTEHKAGTELLAVGLRELYGMELNRDRLSYGQHGKPYLRNHPEIHFNISHCEGLAVCVFSDTETGVDVERIREVKEKVIPKVFDRAEQELLFWNKAEKEKYKEILPFLDFKGKLCEAKWAGNDGKADGFCISAGVGSGMEGSSVYG